MSGNFYRSSASILAFGLSVVGVFAGTVDVLASSAKCSVYLRPGMLGYSTDLNRIERNGSLHGVVGSLLVDTTHSGFSAPVTTPSALALSKSVASLFPAGALSETSVTEIFILDSLDRLEGVAQSVSSEVRRRIVDGVAVDFDSSQDFYRVYIPSAFFDENLALKRKLPAAAFAAEGRSLVRVNPLKRRKLAPLVKGPKKDGSVFVGGLISISAEPPEGFFAASTAAELGKSGWRVAPADEADIWVYRVPDSRPDSYFEFTYASPDRPKPSSYEGKFKVATGIGPSTHPESVGGREADLLWLGDEQMGPLDRYLQKIARPGLFLEDLYVERGVIQRLDDRRVVLAGVNQRYALTQKGFDAMETDPTIYRRVFDREYDMFLLSLFKDSRPNAKNRSFLLATSRGCSQGCSICCSGGLSQFQYFSAPRMMQELEKIASYAKMGPNENFNVFLVDSNFNNNPARIIEFAELYRASPYDRRFDFFIRHNTVNGFLKPGKGGGKVANEELIAAYRTLGIREIFMGVDSFDDASTITLKTHKFKVAKEGAKSRPIYSMKELESLLSAIEAQGLYAKGFFLTNNPWVSDLDRIDAYYNLIELWLKNPHFSIDSARDRNVIRLKPFDGSPIGETSKLMGHSLVKDGRFVARGPMGEMDEIMEFAGLGRPRVDGNVDGVIAEFWTGIEKIRAGAEYLLAAKNAEDREYAKWVLAKLIQRSGALDADLLAFERLGHAAAKNTRQAIARLRKKHSGLPEFDPAVQARMFEENVRSLEEGLRKTNPKKGADLE
jgi:hypothetical protein